MGAVPVLNKYKSVAFISLTDHLQETFRYKFWF